jgi:hypothetical protein
MWFCVEISQAGIYASFALNKRDTHQPTATAQEAKRAGGKKERANKAA